MDDEELTKRLQEIEDLAGAAASEASSGIDRRGLRSELEDVEVRLAGLIEETHQSLGQLASRIESNAASLERVERRLEEVVGTLQDIQGEMPTG